MVEKLTRLTMPMLFGSIQEYCSSQDIRLYEREGIHDGTVHMTFCSKMYYRIEMLAAEKVVNEVFIRNITLYKTIIGSLCYVEQVLQISSVGKRIQICNLIIRIFINKQPYYMRTYKASTSCYQYFFHLLTNSLGCFTSSSGGKDLK